jgi:hypothetical protein
MAAALKRFLDWANQPVSFGKKKTQPFEAIPVLDEQHESVHLADQAQLDQLLKGVGGLDLNNAALFVPANDAHETYLPPLPVEPAKPATPDDYLGNSVEDVVNGMGRFLEAHAITDASKTCWALVMDEVKVIQMKRMRLLELEKECTKIKGELEDCKKNLAMHAKRASAEETMTIAMHEKRLELSRALTGRIDAL